MNSLDNYYRDIIALTNTMVIKIPDVAVAINNGLVEQYDYDIGYEAKYWKYYLNISGQKHPTNNDVLIKLRETGDSVSLTKDILAIYRNTREELLKNGAYYKALVAQYPDEIQYIHGCMLPVDIYYAIEAPTGTILNYNTRLVHSQEYRLIPELQKHIQTFLARYNISEYSIADNLYVPSMLGTLYASIPIKIATIRTNLSNTAEVHPFHLEQYFRSHMDLWDDITVLNKKSLYWLYRNLPTLLKHTGKQATFDKILSKIYDANDVGVGEYIVKIPEPIFTPNINHMLLMLMKL